MLQKVLDSSAFLKVKYPIVRLPILLYQTIIQQAGDYTIQKLMAWLLSSSKNKTEVGSSTVGASACCEATIRVDFVPYVFRCVYSSSSALAINNLPHYCNDDTYLLFPLTLRSQEIRITYFQNNVFQTNTLRSCLSLSSHFPDACCLGSMLLWSGRKGKNSLWEKNPVLII